jgi:hypothetical protein
MIGSMMAQRRHHQSQHRRRHLAHAGKAALGYAKRDHGRNGEQVKQRIGDDGQRVGLSWTPCLRKELALAQPCLCSPVLQ